VFPKIQTLPNPRCKTGLSIFNSVIYTDKKVLNLLNYKCSRQVSTRTTGHQGLYWSVSYRCAYFRDCKLLDYLDMMHLDLSSCFSCLSPLWQEAFVIYGRLWCLSTSVVWVWRAVPQIPSREIICFSLCFLPGFGVHSFRLQCTSLALC